MKNQKQNKMKTFSQIKLGEHLSNRCLDLLVISITNRFINGYDLSLFRKTGKIEVCSVHRSQFENRLITENLIITQPTENIASKDQLNSWDGIKRGEMSNIEII